MKTAQALQADGPIDDVEHLRDAGGRADVITGGEGVASVEAEAEALGVSGLHHGGDFFEGRAQRRAAAGGVFHENFRRAGNFAFRSAHRFRDARAAGVGAGAHVVADVKDVEARAELVRALEFSNEGVARFLIDLVVARGEINKVSGVDNDRVKIRFDDASTEGFDEIGIERRLQPAARVAAEDLQRLAAERAGQRRAGTEGKVHAEAHFGKCESGEYASGEYESMRD